MEHSPRDSYDGSHPKFYMYESPFESSTLLSDRAPCHGTGSDTSQGGKHLVNLSDPFLSGLPSPPPEMGLSSPSYQVTQESPFSYEYDSIQVRSPPTTPPPFVNQRSVPRTRKKYHIAADRFIPVRSFSDAVIDTFRSSKSPHELSPDERLLRHQSAEFDPFGSAIHSSRREVRSSMRTRGQRYALNSPLGPTRNGGVLGVRSNSASLLNRQASLGGVWSFATVSGDASGPIPGVSNGRGGLMGRGTNAPMYSSRFFEGDNPEEALEKHEGRLALALDFDQANKVLSFGTTGITTNRRASHGMRILKNGSLNVSPDRGHPDVQTIWKDNEWVKEGMVTLLDAPRLRDDFYCSLMAYCAATRCLAVGLHTSVFLWSELKGVQPCNLIPPSFAYVTSLAFSSTEGHQSILAIGRADGKLTLWSTADATARLEAQHQSSIACVSFKPRVTYRRSMRDSDCLDMVPVEILLVGHENGIVHYYAVEWPSKQDRLLHHWDGMLTLLARVNVHSQQICGLSWSLEGDFFATGGNDNACCLFEVSSIFGLGSDGGIDSPRVSEEVFMDQHGILKRRHRAIPGQGFVREIVKGGEKFRWVHSAAVKAIAFCPWQRGLIATGGGSNDRCIHFYHTFSGACLATIDVSAQVTSLIWSTTRREIAATFGYAQPEHPFRIAVFSWPDCRQIVAIPWPAESRALSAIAYPGGPSDPQAGSSGREGRAWTSRTAEEGCIVVASSDESIKFQEIWSETKRSTGGLKGLFGGSDILEGMEGVDKDFAETIR